MPKRHSNSSHHLYDSRSFGNTYNIQVKQIRPFVAAAILRNVSFNDKTYKAFITAQ